MCTKQKVRTGPRGGKYKLVRGKKVYLKSNKKKAGGFAAYKKPPKSAKYKQVMEIKRKLIADRMAKAPRPSAAQIKKARSKQHPYQKNVPKSAKYKQIMERKRKLIADRMAKYT